MSVSEEDGAITARLKRLTVSLWFPAALIFLCFGVVAICAVQRQYGLGMPVPRNTILTTGGFLEVAGRMLGISSLSRQQLTVLYMSVLAVMYAAYVWALVLIARRGKRVRGAFIIGTSMAFCLWVLFVPPILAQDLFNYAAYGKAISVYGKNPYLAVPRDFPREAVLHYIGWTHTPSVYGPLFNYMAAAVTAIAGKSASTNSFAFKLLAFGFFSGSLFIIEDLGRRLVPDKQDFVLLAAAWNPLVIIHLVGGGHNDTIMVFLVLGGFLLYRKGYPVLAIASTMLAGMIKSTALFVLIPMLVLFLRQNAMWPLRKYVQAALTAVAIPLVLYLPTWPGLKGFKTILSVGTGYSGISVPRFFREGVRSAMRGLGVASSSAGSFSYSATRTFFMFVFLALLVLFCWRVRDVRSLAFYSGAIMFTFMFTTSWLMPWYAGFMMILVALSGSYLWTGTGVAVTFAMAWYGRGINGWGNNVFPILMLIAAFALIVGLVLRGRKPMPTCEPGFR